LLWFAFLCFCGLLCFHPRRIPLRLHVFFLLVMCFFFLSALFFAIVPGLILSGSLFFRFPHLRVTGCPLRLRPVLGRHVLGFAPFSAFPFWSSRFLSRICGLSLWGASGCAYAFRVFIFRWPSLLSDRPPLWSCSCFFSSGRRVPGVSMYSSFFVCALPRSGGLSTCSAGLFLFFHSPCRLSPCFVRVWLRAVCCVLPLFFGPCLWFGPPPLCCAFFFLPPCLASFRPLFLSPFLFRPPLVVSWPLADAGAPFLSSRSRLVLTGHPSCRPGPLRSRAPCSSDFPPPLVFFFAGSFRFPPPHSGGDLFPPSSVFFFLFRSSAPLFPVSFFPLAPLSARFWRLGLSWRCLYFNALVPGFPFFPFRGAWWYIGSPLRYPPSLRQPTLPSFRSVPSLLPLRFCHPRCSGHFLLGGPVI